jgi:hypothetical protein
MKTETLSRVTPQGDFTIPRPTLFVSVSPFAMKVSGLEITPRATMGSAYISVDGVGRWLIRFQNFVIIESEIVDHLIELS